MGQYKRLFIVSAIAILFSTGANAAATAVTGLATPNYVDGAIDALPAVARTGSYTDLTNKPTLGSLAAKSAVGAAEITDGAVGAAEIATDAVGAAEIAAGAVGTAELAANAVTSAKIADGTIVNADISASAAIAQSKISGLTTALSGKQPTLTVGDTGNIKGSGSVTVTKDDAGAIIVSGTDTKYTLPAAGSALGGVKTGGDMTASSGTLTITNGKVTSAKIADGTIANADVATNAAIAVSKIDGAQTTANIVTEANIAANKTSDTKYPSMAAARQIAADAAADAVSSNTSAIAGMDLTNPTGNGVIKSISQTDGNVSAGRGLVATADLADNAVTTVKITDKNVTKAKLADAVQTSLGKADSALQSVTGGAAVSGKVATAVTKNGTAVAVTMDYVKIPVGSATAPTSVAQIWVQ